MRGTLGLQRDKLSGRPLCPARAAVLESTAMSVTRNGIDIPPHIFREYDIRGVALDGFGKEVELTPGFTELLGRAVATMLAEHRRTGKPRVVVGRDARQSGESLAYALSTGLRSAGADVIDDSEL